MPLQATSGAASYDAFGGGVPVVPQYIEEVFSTWLFTGNGSAQTITNSIDLSTNGGLVWIKPRIADTSNTLYDTARGINKQLSSESDGAESTTTGTLTAFNTNGFSIGTSENASTSGSNNVSWTFRKQPKFFDVVTWTGSGANRTIAHNLGSVPGCIIVKRRNTFKDWQVYHRSLANTEYLVLNTTDAKATGATRWNSTTPTSTVFSLGTDSSVNASGDTYVAYLFAHDAGGFGLTGTDNVISCGSFTSNSSGGISPVDLGFEPQWLLVKNTSSDGWRIQDVMRGWSQTQLQDLSPSNADAERVLNNNPSYLSPTATGFSTPTPGIFTANNTFIYIAIRRPMKVPTDATKVFNPVYGQSGAPGFRSTNFNAGIDTAFYLLPAGYDDGTNAYPNLQNRLIGLNQLQTINTRTELSLNYNKWDYMNGVTNLTFLDTSFASWMFKRASGFHDVVCYTGTGSTRTVTHNLGVTPELVITKSRSQALGWVVWTTSLTSTDYWIRLDDTMAQANSPTGYGGTFSASAYTIANTGPYDALNNSGSTYVAYLFATCAGVSKVGSYTGTGTTKQIDCGFTGGARFVLIKRTDSTGDWYAWDSARGIVSGNDPYQLLNSAAAEVTNTDYIDTYSAGFEISSTAPAAINASGGSFIFLAIA
jgi:hypothetical protein